MTGVQRFLTNDRNQIVGASLTPSATKSCTDTVTAGPHTRAGYGRIDLTGTYTGSADATFDLEIVSDPGAALRISQPVFAGTGNGTLSSISANGVTPQQITLTLASLGIPTERASLDLGVAKLWAKTTGTNGNDITIAASLAGLTVATTMLLAMPEGLQAGASASTNPDWDCGQPALNAAGEVPSSAPRVVFGGDLSAVYRLYKRFIGGKWSYEITPPLLRPYEEETDIRVVTGSYTVTLTKGQTVETYASITTWYQFLAALASSSLVYVEGVVIDDRLPGGLGTLDLALRTSAVPGAVTSSGSDYAKKATLENLTATASAPSQQLTIRCVDITKSGAEQWEVRSNILGKLSDLAVTDLLYSPATSPLQFKIPRQKTSTSPSATIMWTNSYAQRSQGQVSPPVCARGLTLGVNAAPKSLTFTYRQRPSANCDCSLAMVSGNPIAIYLGLEGEIDVTSLDSNYAARLLQLYEFRQDWIQGETAVVMTGATTARLNATTREIAFVEAATKIFRTALEQYYADEKARNAWDLVFADMKTDLRIFFSDQDPVDTEPTFTIGWVAATKFWQGAYTIPTTGNDNGRFYALTAITNNASSGNSGNSEPTWPTNGGTVVDNALTWTDMGLRQPLPATVTYNRYDATMVPVGTTRKLGQEFKVGWQANYFYGGASSVSIRTIPTLANDNGHYYELVSRSGKSGANEPTWPTNGSTVSDGDLTWLDKGLRYTANLAIYSNKAWSAGNLLQPSGSGTYNGHWYVALSAGATGSEPTWPTNGGTVTQNGVVFLDLGFYRGDSLWATADLTADANNGHYYQAQTAGYTSHADKSWPTDGSTVVDGTVVWKDMGTNINLDRTDSTYRVRTGTKTSTKTASTSQAALDSASTESAFLQRYQARLDVIGIGVGIVPGKSNGSSGGAGCWTDPGDTYWWEVPGYMPAFTNRLWYSAVRNADGEIVSTQEFAFALACACVSDLKEGDQITVTIGNVGGRGITYAIGDEFTVPVWGYASLATAGGVSGNDTLTWRVAGSVSTFPDYSLTLAEPAYSQSGLAFQLHRGAVPFVLGDTFVFAVENSGKFKWRKNGGSWSADTAISSTVLLSDGLSAVFTNGIAPSFVATDLYHFAVDQPYAAAHVAGPLPLEEGWNWTGASATLDIDLGSAKSLEAVGILIHALPAAATLLIAGGTTSPPTDWLETYSVAPGPLVRFFAARSTRYLRVSVGSATGGSIGWLWAGAPLALSKSATSMSLQRRFAFDRSGGIFALARYAGAGIGGRIGWANALRQTDIDAWLTMLAAVKAAGDQPIVFLPNYRQPDEAALVRLSDDHEITDYHLFQPTDDSRRLLSLDITLDPVYL